MMERGYHSSCDNTGFSQLDTPQRNYDGEVAQGQSTAQLPVSCHTVQPNYEDGLSQIHGATNSICSVATRMECSDDRVKDDESQDFEIYMDRPPATFCQQAVSHSSRLSRSGEKLSQLPQVLSGNNARKHSLKNLTHNQSPNSIMEKSPLSEKAESPLVMKIKTEVIDEPLSPQPWEIGQTFQDHEVEKEVKLEGKAASVVIASHDKHIDDHASSDTDLESELMTVKFPTAEPKCTARKSVKKRPVGRPRKNTVKTGNAVTLERPKRKAAQMAASIVDDQSDDDVHEHFDDDADDASTDSDYYQGEKDKSGTVKREKKNNHKAVKHRTTKQEKNLKPRTAKSEENKRRRNFTGIKSWVCETCHKPFINKSKLKKHSIVHSSERPHQCELCPKAFLRWSDLNIHKKIHSGVRNHDCVQCGKSFYRAGDLKAHMTVHSGVRPHVCDVCGRTFKEPKTLRNHRLIHDGVKPFVCDVCGKGFVLAGALKVHKVIHADSKPYRCDDCGKQFAQAGNLKHHQLQHTDDRSHVCHVCGMGFADPRALKRHMIKHSDTPFMCHICHKVLADPRSLKNHSLLHLPESKLFECKVCSKSYTRADTLARHMVIHSGQKKHVCEICSKAFTEAGTLKSHQLIHADFRPYHCEFCGKGFCHAGDLKRHVLVHTGEKPHVCDICNKAFTRVKTLKTHRARHGQGPLPDDYERRYKQVSSPSESGSTQELSNTTTTPSTATTSQIIDKEATDHATLATGPKKERLLELCQETRDRGTPSVSSKERLPDFSQETRGNGGFSSQSKNGRASFCGLKEESGRPIYSTDEGYSGSYYSAHKTVLHSDDDDYDNDDGLYVSVDNEQESPSFSSSVTQNLHISYNEDQKMQQNLQEKPYSEKGSVSNTFPRERMFNPHSTQTAQTTINKAYLSDFTIETYNYFHRDTENVETKTPKDERSRVPRESRPYTYSRQTVNMAPDLLAQYSATQGPPLNNTITHTQTRRKEQKDHKDGKHNELKYAPPTFAPVEDSVPFTSGLMSKKERNKNEDEKNKTGNDEEKNNFDDDAKKERGCKNSDSEKDDDDDSDRDHDEDWTSQQQYQIVRSFMCETCGKTFPRACDVRKHSIVHSAERPHKCDCCDRAFARWSDLKTHKRIHTGERTHPCTQCSKAYFRASDLKNHMLTHLGIRPHVCEECGKMFTEVKTLRTHKLTHGGVKAHQCSECGRAFLHLAGLRHHMNQHAKAATSSLSDMT